MRYFSSIAASTIVIGRERGVERRLRRGKVDSPREGERVGRPPLAVHAGVLPLDGERAGVSGSVERADDLLEVDVAVARGDEVPTPVRMSEVQVRAEQRAAPVDPPLGVLDVHVEDAVGELGYEG